MEDNIILKNLVRKQLLNNNTDLLKKDIENLFDNVSNFTLFNIIGKNDLYKVGIILFFIFGWFIRQDLKSGTLVGVIVLSIAFYIYYTYKYDDIKSYSIDKQQKTRFLDILLSNTNYYPVEGNVFYDDNYLNFRDFKQKSFLYLNPAMVDFFYNNRELITYSYLNYVKTLQTVNAIIILNQELLAGVNNRGNQYENFLGLRDMALNYFQAIITTLPSAKATNRKYQDALNILQELLQKMVENIQKKIEIQNEQSGVNTEYYPIYRGGAKPNDTSSYGYNAHFNVF